MAMLTLGAAALGWTYRRRRAAAVNTTELALALLDASKAP
jgi:hypothetical protein